MKNVKLFEEFWSDDNDFLYHYTSIENAVKIVNDGMIKVRPRTVANKYANNVFSDDYGYVSFTENDEYHDLVSTEIPSEVRFVFDKDKMNKKYKLESFDANKQQVDSFYAELDDQENEIDDLERTSIPHFGDEMEQRIYQNVPLKGNLIRIDSIDETLDSKFIKELVELCNKKGIKITDEL